MIEEVNDVCELYKKKNRNNKNLKLFLIITLKLIFVFNWEHNYVMNQALKKQFKTFA